MANEMTIKLTNNLETRKRDITISLKSDPNMLPHEHEDLHRKVVGQLVGAGVLKESDLGNVKIEREPVTPVTGGDTAVNTPEKTAVAGNA